MGKPAHAAAADADEIRRRAGRGGESYMRYFTETELRGLVLAADFAVEDLVHTDDLGQTWGNVFVLMGRAV